MRRNEDINLNHPEIGHKLFIFFMFMAVIVAAPGGFGIWSIDRVNDGRVQDVIKTRTAQERTIALVKADLRECRLHLLEAAMLRSETAEFDHAKSAFAAKISHLRSDCDLILKRDKKLGMEAAPRDNRLETGVTALKQGVTEFEIVADNLLTRKAELLKRRMDATGDTQFNRWLWVDIPDASNKIDAGVDELLVTIASLMNKSTHDLSLIRQSTIKTFILVIISAVLMVMIMGFLATRHLRKRIKFIAEALNKGASGDLTIKVVTDSTDELGRLGVNFNVMTEKLAGMVGKVNKTNEELTRITNNLAETSKQLISAAQRQADGVLGTSSAMTQINATLKGVTQGVDGLSLSAAESSSSILEIAASIEEVALNVVTLSQSVEEVSSSIVEMATSIKEIDSSVASLTESIGTTASSVMEMDSSIRQVEKNAMDTAAISEEVRKDAEMGKEAVVATISGIREIRRSSGITYEVINTLSVRAGEIGTILSVIDEVAEQTNLLALNAAIIAAQAGERGKGFAVVADEIKELAERTSSSIREIDQVIKGVQNETARAVEAINLAEKSITDGELLSQKSGEALTKIVTGVGKASARMDEIARTTIEQAKGSEMIRDAMEQVLKMVTQIAMATREQGLGGELIMAAVVKMKELTAQVNSSTREQSKAGNFIANSTENITGMIRQIKRACDEQGRGSEQVVVAIEDIKQSTDINLNATNVMNDAVMNLFHEIEIMHKEIGAFKI